MFLSGHDPARRDHSCHSAHFPGRHLSEPRLVQRNQGQNRAEACFRGSVRVARTSGTPRRGRSRRVGGPAAPDQPPPPRVPPSARPAAAERTGQGRSRSWEAPEPGKMIGMTVVYLVQHGGKQPGPGDPG